MWSKELTALLDKYYLPDSGKPFNDTIPDEVLVQAYSDGLFRCFLPEDFEGLNRTAADTFEMLRKISFYNGSLGWLIQIGNGGNYFVSCFEPESAKKLLGTRNDVIAGSGHPSGNAVRTEDGYMISGVWPHCSGADHTKWFTITFVDPENGQKKAALISRQDVEVIPNWKAIGLRQSSTHSIRLTECVVKDEQVFDVTVQKWIPKHDLFKVPFVIYAQLFFLQVAIGVLQRLSFEAKSILQHNELRWKDQDPWRLERLKELLFRSKGVVRTTIRRSDEIVRESLSEKDEMKHRQELLFLAGKVRQLGHDLFHELGISVVTDDHPVSVFYRDLLVTTQHYLLRQE